MLWRVGLELDVCGTCADEDDHDGEGSPNARRSQLWRFRYESKLFGKSTIRFLNDNGSVSGGGDCETTSVYIKV